MTEDRPFLSRFWDCLKSSMLLVSIVVVLVLSTMALAGVIALSVMVIVMANEILELRDLAQENAAEIWFLKLLVRDG